MKKKQSLVGSTPNLIFKDYTYLSSFIMIWCWFLIEVFKRLTFEIVNANLMFKNWNQVIMLQIWIIGFKSILLCCQYSNAGFLSFFLFWLVKKSLLYGLKKSMNSFTNNHFLSQKGKSISRPPPPFHLTQNVCFY